MVLRNSEVYAHIDHVLPGSLGEDITPFSILEQAADWLSAAHSWRFLMPRQVRLELRGRITIATATYTHATRNLLKTGAFADYTFLEGDVFDATGGTGVVAKDYVIESRTDDDNIVLASPGLGSAADAAADIAGSCRLDSIPLPSDFMAAIAVSSTDSLVNGINWTTPEGLVRRRTTQIDVSSSWQYWAAIAWAKNAEDAVVPIMDIWPIPVANDVEGFTMFYRRRIAVVDEDTAAIPIPAEQPLVNALLIRAARAIAMGYEEGDEADGRGMDVRLAELQLGPMWKAATRKDGLSQPTMGRMKGGAVTRMPRYTRKLLSSQVDAPT